MAVLFHHSSKANRESILSDGLRLEFDQTGQGAIFLTTDDKASSRFDCYEVNVDGLELQDDWSTDEDGCYMHFGNIPVERIRLHGV